MIYDNDVTGFINLVLPASAVTNVCGRASQLFDLLGGAVEVTANQHSLPDCIT